MIDGFWNVVDDLSQAHFILKYYVDLEGRDKAHILVMTPNGNIQKSLASSGSSESSNENREVARNLYLNSIMPLYKSIERGKYPKTIK